MEVIFGILMAVGLGYLLLTIIGVGDIFDLDADSVLDTLGIGTLYGLDDATGFGCTILAAFMAGFGSFGLAGALSGWSLPVVVVVSVIAGYIFGRLVLIAFRFLKAQQTAPHHETMDDLIGKIARVTLEATAGKTGEVMIEEGEVARYPVKEIGGSDLKRDDVVEIVDVQGRFLHVKKKRV
jgi:membrane protein implicated in regulation of membrane protease activity